MWRAAFVLALALVLGGCPAALRVTCPPKTNYSQATQNRLADELEAMGDQYPTVRRFTSDYRKTRKAIDRCLAKRATQRGK